MDILNKEIQKQYERMGINSDVLNISDEIINDLSQRFQKIDKIAEYNQLKVVSAFQKIKWQRNTLTQQQAMAITI